LLPWWIKVFMWIFLVGGVFVIGIAAAAVFGITATLSIYGFDTSEIVSPVGILLVIVYSIKAVTSYGLIAQKDWAIKIGLVDASLGIFLCLVAMIYPFLYGQWNFSLRLELALLFPYLLRLLRIRVEWENSLPG